MKSNVENFVIEMSENSTVKSNYMKNPRLTMLEAGLDEQSIETILSGDQNKLSVFFGSDSEMIITGIIHLVPNAERH